MHFFHILPRFVRAHNFFQMCNSACRWSYPRVVDPLWGACKNHAIFRYDDVCAKFREVAVCLWVSLTAMRFRPVCFVIAWHCRFRTQFSAYERMLHLSVIFRKCGLVFCGNCSDYQIPLPQDRLYYPVRVCRSCYVELSKQNIGLKALVNRRHVVSAQQPTHAWRWRMEHFVDFGAANRSDKCRFFLCHCLRSVTGRGFLYLVVFCFSALYQSWIFFRISHYLSEYAIWYGINICI